MADFSEEPLRSALQGIVQPKLVEFGWTTDPEDSNLFEYILLMLLNNKDEAQIASELSNDLLDLGPDNPETQQFARWLFDQINMLRGQLNGNTAGDAEASHATGDHMEDTNQAAAPGQDTEMGGAPEPGQGNKQVTIRPRNNSPWRRGHRFANRNPASQPARRPCAMAAVRRRHAAAVCSINSIDS